MKNLILLFVVLTFILGACEKKEANDFGTKKNFVTEEQKLLLAKMDEAAQVIAIFTSDEQVNNEISMFIKKKMYKDDFIFFKDLFEPDANSVLKSSNMSETVFSKLFRKASEGMSLKSGTVNDLEDFLIENNLALYVPYPLEDYPADKQIPTISFHPLLNDSLNYGYKQLVGNVTKSSNINAVEYELIEGVGEEYAQENPVYAIIPREPEEPQFQSPTSSSGSSTVHQIKVGWVYLTKHYDSFFSGGSEIRISVGGVSIGADGHVTGVVRQQIPLDMERSYINNAQKGYWKGWKQFNIVLETNWEVVDTELAVVVWEKDDKKESKISMIAKRIAQMDLKDPVTGSIYKEGFELSPTVEVKYNSEDGIIYAMPWDRNWFMVTNTNWQDWSFQGYWGRDGFSFRRLTEHLIITTPHQEINY